MKQDWNEYIEMVSNLVESREKYQKSLGQVSSTIASLYGSTALLDFAKEIEDATGRKISPTTLRNYRWVWEKTSALNLPEDFPYRAYQAIAGSKDPQGWANAVHKMGLSGDEVIHLIREEKGQIDRKKEIICPECGNKFLK